MMRRLKRFGASRADLLDTYIKQFRSVLELAVPLWHPALTVYDVGQIERVHKSALAIILGTNYRSYRNGYTGREKKVTMCEICPRTGRFENSPIPYLTKLLNDHYR